MDFNFYKWYKKTDTILCMIINKVSVFIEKYNIN